MMCSLRGGVPRSVVAILTLSAVLSLSACGGGGSDSPQPERDVHSASPAPEETTSTLPPPENADAGTSMHADTPGGAPIDSSSMPHDANNAAHGSDTDLGVNAGTNTGTGTNTNTGTGSETNTGTGTGTNTGADTNDGTNTNSDAPSGSPPETPSTPGQGTQDAGEPAKAPESETNDGASNGTSDGTSSGTSDGTSDEATRPRDDHLLHGVLEGLGPDFGKNKSLVKLFLSRRTILTVAKDGNFVFDHPFQRDEPYSVTIAVQPPGRRCAVENGEGRFAVPLSRPIKVSCVDRRQVAITLNKLGRTVSSFWLNPSNGNMTGSGQRRSTSASVRIALFPIQPDNSHLRF